MLNEPDDRARCGMMGRDSRWRGLERGDYIVSALATRSNVRWQLRTKLVETAEQNSGGVDLVFYHLGSRLLY